MEDAFKGQKVKAMKEGLSGYNNDLNNTVLVYEWFVQFN